MNPCPNWITTLKDRAGTRRVLLVEGSRDEAIMEKWLSHLDPDYDSRFLVRRAGEEDKDYEWGGTARVIQGLKHVPEWRGLVDRDERTDDEIAQEEAGIPALRFLPRYCIENYFTVPDEIWACFPEHQRESRPQGQDSIRNGILAEVDRWVAHWSIWRTLRKREQLLKKTMQFPDGVIQYVLDHYPLTEKEIEQRLTPWRDFFEPAAIRQEYDELMRKANAEPLDSRLKRHLHGRKFFSEVVVNLLSQFKRQSASAWYGDLVASYPGVPTDIEPILRDFLADLQAD